MRRPINQLIVAPRQPRFFVTYPRLTGYCTNDSDGARALSHIPQEIDESTEMSNNNTCSIDIDNSGRSHALFYVVAVAFICRNSKVLLTRRSKAARIAPDFWHLPGGHVELGETTAEAVKREILEELSLALRVGGPYFTFSYCNSEWPTLGVAHLAIIDGTSRISHSAETADSTWVTIEHARSLLRSNCDHNLQLCERGFEAARRSLDSDYT